MDYAIIRLGYRGTAAAGNCAMDPYFEQNIKGALEAGLQVGVYYFTQAITVEEAIAAENAGADYIGVGAVFGTSTKKNARNLTVEKLKEISTYPCKNLFGDGVAEAIEKFAL